MREGLVINKIKTLQDIKDRIILLTEFVKKTKIKDSQKMFTNLHIHTNYSYSVFSSPSEATLKAYLEGIEYFGISDHYSVGGHREFSIASMILGIKPIFGLELVCMDFESAERGLKYNDPGNPGKVYLCAKGITTYPPKNSKFYLQLERLKQKQIQRNRRIITKLNNLLHNKQLEITLSWDEVKKLASDNITERHIIEALLIKVKTNFSHKFLKRVLEDITETTLENMEDIYLQKVLRNRLLKKGRPCYVEERQESFCTLEEAITLFKAFGAKVVYPVLGNPITEKEKDLAKLFKDLKKAGIEGIEVIPERNSSERLKEIVNIAEKYKLPVFCGTEHNTKEIKSLIPPVKDKKIIKKFFDSAKYIYQYQQKNRII